MANQFSVFNTTPINHPLHKKNITVVNQTDQFSRTDPITINGVPADITNWQFEITVEFKYVSATETGDPVTWTATSNPTDIFYGSPQRRFLNYPINVLKHTTVPGVVRFTLPANMYNLPIAYNEQHRVPIGLLWWKITRPGPPDIITSTNEIILFKPGYPA